MSVRFKNAVFHTMESPSDTRRSMTVEYGVITAFDDDTPGVKTVDLGGAHVFPALTDSHLHMLDTIALSGVSFPVCELKNGGVEPRDLAGVGEKIRAYSASRPKGSLLVGSSYIAAGIAEGRLPNRFELDAWTGGGRAFILNLDGHSSSCSTAFLTELGLEDKAPDGILSGEAHEFNMGKVSDKLASAVTPRVLGDGIAAFCNACAGYGIGRVCALEGTESGKRDRLTELIAFLAQRFPLAVRLFPQYMDDKYLAPLEKRMGARRVGGCMKWELDGSVGSRSAAFRKPFLDGRQGKLYYSDEELSKTVRHFDELGYLISAHAIGELAIEQLTGLYETASARHRIDHCEFPSKEVLPRLYALKPYITVQPGYAWVDKRFMKGYEKWLSPEMIAQQVPLKDLASHGAVLLGSSDSPVQSVDPFLQMRGMREFYVEDQSLSALEALKSYTVNSGPMLGEKIGLLREGYEASFFTIDRDLLSIPPEALEGAKAKSLFLAGKPYRPMRGGVGTLLRLLLARPKKI